MNSSRKIVIITALALLFVGLIGLSPVSRSPLYGTPGAIFRPEKSDILFGRSRSVRSDEFLSFTPRTLGLAHLQDQLDERADYSPLLGAGVRATPIGYAPSGRSWMKLLNTPHGVLFHFFPSGWAYGVSWAILEVFLLLGAGTLLNHFVTLEGRAAKLIFFTGIWGVAFNRSIVRWLTSGVGLAFAYGGLLLFAIQFFLNSKTPAKRLLGLFILISASAGFVASGYPPAQYSAAVLIGPTAILLFWRARAKISMLLLGGVACLSGAGIGFYYSLLPFLRELMLTGLSGRSLSGGGYDLNGFRNLIVFKERIVGNECEGAVPWIAPWVIAALIALIFYRKQVRQQLTGQTMRIVLPLAISAIFGLIWMFAPIPNTVARWIALDRVSINRMSVEVYSAMIGVLAIFLLRIIKVLPRSGRAWVTGLTVIQLWALGRDFMFNPLAWASDVARPTTVVTEIKEKTGGALLLPSDNMVFGSPMATFGIRTLTGRFDDLAPEASAFLFSISKAIQVGTAREFQSLFYTMNYFSWTSSETFPNIYGDQLKIPIDPCRPEIRNFGVSHLLLTVDEYPKLVRSCRAQFEIEPITFPSKGEAVLVKYKHKLPFVRLEGLGNLELVSDLQDGTNILNRRVRIRLPDVFGSQEFGYAWRWAPDGLHVQLDQELMHQVTALDKSPVAIAALEGRYFERLPHANEAVCDALNTRSGNWDMPLARFVEQAGQCVFKRKQIDRVTGQATFRLKSSL